MWLDGPRFMKVLMNSFMTCSYWVQLQTTGYSIAYHRNNHADRDYYGGSFNIYAFQIWLWCHNNYTAGHTCYLLIYHACYQGIPNDKKKMDELRTGTLLWWLHAEEKEYWRSPQTAVQTVLHFRGIMGVHHELLIWCTLQAWGINEYNHVAAFLDHGSK